MKKILIAGLFILAFAANACEASVVTWTDWQSNTTNTAAGTVGGVGVTVINSNPFYFVQTGIGQNYWTEPNALALPYTGNATVDNAPTPRELIAIYLSDTITIAFDSAVVNPIMAIVSQGQPNIAVTYDFDAPFNVLGEGHGAYGNGSYTLGAGNQLIGSELHGVIQFQGTFNSISFTTSPNETWHGFTIGTVEANSVPEPASLLTFAGLASCFGLGLIRRRRK